MITVQVAMLRLRFSHHTEFTSMSWDLRDSIAKWQGSNWSVEVALKHAFRQPLLQIRDREKRTLLTVAVTPSEPQVKHSAAELLLGDAYVRQNDLIAMFPESAPWPFGYQIDTRVLNDRPPDTLAVEIWLSIQTSLLDSHPQLELHLNGERFNLTGENCWTSESSRMGLLVHPLDQQDSLIEQRRDALAMRVFGRFMEKGVIRRMRFRLIVTLRPETAVFWKDRLEEFSNSPLPLTT